MALPSSGPISLNDLRTLTGQSSLSWVQANTKDAIKNMNSMYGRNYYQRNVDGNCNNANCTSNCNCGDIQCNNCLITGTVNCLNCDTQSWLQADCNCGTPYNCTSGPTSYNCNCDCACDCNCNCGG